MSEQRMLPVSVLEKFPVYSPAMNKKKLLRLCCETLKFRAFFDRLLEDEDINSLLDEPFVKGDVNLLYVLLYEYLIGTGLGKQKWNIAFARRSKAIQACEKKLNQQGIGREAAENTKKQELPRYARINTLKWTEEEAHKALKEDDWKIISLEEEDDFRSRVSSLVEDEVLVDPHVPLLLVFPHHPDFHSYWMVEQRFLILQDKASCLPAFLLAPKKDSHVIDACSAPGMKTSHVAAILEGTGRVYAVDRSGPRLKEAKALLAQCGASNVRFVCDDFLRLDANDPEYAQVEYILVDPPCSGSGMVKRMDECVDDRVDEHRLAKLANLQAMILKHAMTFPSVRRIVYSTCSIHETENEGVISEVSDQSDFHIVEDILPSWTTRGNPGYVHSAHALRAHPNTTLTNGFFVTVFERKGTEKKKRKGKKRKAVGDVM